jgi:hypothetical protein
MIDVVPLRGEPSLGWLLIAAGATILVVSTLAIYWSEGGTSQDCYTMIVLCGLVILAGVFIEDWVVGQALVGVGAIVLLILWLRRARAGR